MDVVTNTPENPEVAVPPVVALYCTQGMEAFLSNAIAGILNVGIDAGQIYVCCPENALDAVAANRYFPGIGVIADRPAPSGMFSAKNYSDFGSEPFIEICWRKVHFLRDMLSRHFSRSLFLRTPRFFSNIRRAAGKVIANLRPVPDFSWLVETVPLAHPAARTRL
jgi:hypothetical protein